MGRYLGYVGLNNRRKGVSGLVRHSNCEGGAVNRGANRKEWRSENAGENGISTGERECWSLIMYNVNIPMGREKTKSTMRLAIK